jgi:hypothetical protein
MNAPDFVLEAKHFWKLLAISTLILGLGIAGCTSPTTPPPPEQQATPPAAQAVPPGQTAPQENPAVAPPTPPAGEEEAPFPLFTSQQIIDQLSKANAARLISSVVGTAVTTAAPPRIQIIGRIKPPSAALVATAVSASDLKETKPAGGTGGTPFDPLTCENGEDVAGLMLQAKEVVNKVLEIDCRSHDLSNVHNNDKWVPAPGITDDQVNQLVNDSKIWLEVAPQGYFLTKLEVSVSTATANTPEVISRLRPFGRPVNNEGIIDTPTDISLDPRSAPIPLEEYLLMTGSSGLWPEWRPIFSAGKKGPNDSSDKVACDEGYFLHGLKGKAGDDLDSLVGICQKFAPNGTPETPPNFKLTDKSGGKPVPNENAHAQGNPNTAVNTYFPIVNLIAAFINTPGVVGNIDLKPFNFECPSDQVMTTLGADNYDVEKILCKPLNSLGDPKQANQIVPRTVQIPTAQDRGKLAGFSLPRNYVGTGIAVKTAKTQHCTAFPSVRSWRIIGHPFTQNGLDESELMIDRNGQSTTREEPGWEKSECPPGYVLTGITGSVDKTGDCSVNLVEALCGKVTNALIVP